jgi:hypothetical protein
VWKGEPASRRWRHGEASAVFRTRIRVAESAKAATVSLNTVAAFVFIVKKYLKND